MKWGLLGSIGCLLSIITPAVFAAEPEPLTNVPPATVESKVTTAAQETDRIASPEEVFIESDEIQLTNCLSNGICLTPGAASAKGYPTVNLTGFAQIDAVFFNQDASSGVAEGDIQDFAGFRRARLAAVGDIAQNMNYMIEMDFAFPGRPSFMDVWVQVKDVPLLGTLRIGQFRQPFSMDALTSVRELMFLERALPFAFVPFRQIGVGSFNSALDDRVTWAGSVYRFPTDVFGNAFGDSGYGLSGRATMAPLYDECHNEVLHFGAGYTYNNPGNSYNAAGVVSNNVLRYRAAPEVGFTNGELSDTVAVTNLGITGPFFADTGTLANVNNTNVFNVEAAYSRGSFLLQGEFFDALVNQAGGNNYNYTGAYAHASYVLTGEQHKYNKKNAVFGRVIPRHNLGHSGWGAWEVAGRWSYIDLRDSPNVFNPANPAAAIPARLVDLTLGLNWYWNAFAKMQFNYIHAFQSIDLGPDTGTDILALRTQFDF